MLTSLHGHHLADLLRSHDLTPPADEVAEARRLDAEYNRWLDGNPQLKAQKQIEGAYLDWQVALSFIQEIDDQLNQLTDEERNQGWFIDGRGTGNPIRWTVIGQLQRRAQYVAEAERKRLVLAEAAAGEQRRAA